MGLLRIFGALPVIPTKQGGNGWFTNRRAEEKGICAISDVTQNASDWWHRWTRRLPMGTKIYRDHKNRIIGYGSR